MAGFIYKLQNIVNITPNNDSLRPVIDFVTDDIRHLINTMEWK